MASEAVMDISCEIRIRNDNVRVIDYAIENGRRLDEPLVSDFEHRSLLYMAVEYNAAKVVQTLLAIPGLDINVPAKNKLTPFTRMCMQPSVNNASLCILKAFLADERTNLHVKNRANTALELLFSWGHTDAIRWWIAYGREIPLQDKYVWWDLKGRHGQLVYVPHEPKEEITRLLDSYRADQYGTRYLVRKRLGLKDDLPAEWFALIVFAADGLLTLKNHDKEGKVGRFLTMALALPLELQMIMCCRVVGDATDLIKSTTCEQAFRYLGHTLSKS
jgi:hypothetical protein